MESTPLEFWHQNVGKKLGEFSAVQSTGCMITHRNKSSIGPSRIGSSGVVYMISPGDARLVSRINLPDQPGLRFIPSERVSGLKYLAHWLLNEAKPPYMIGQIAKANPLSSFAITHNERLGVFCDTSGDIYFDMERVRQGVVNFAPFPWKVVSSAIYRYAEYRLDPSEMKKENLQKVLKKHPGLREAIIKTDIRARSGEQAIMTWLNLDDSKKTKEQEGESA